MGLRLQNTIFNAKVGISLVFCTDDSDNHCQHSTYFEYALCRSEAWVQQKAFEIMNFRVVRVELSEL